MWIRTQKGLVICVGCCHAGLINTLTYIRQLDAQEPVRAILGGFHLGDASKSRLNHTLNGLVKMTPQQIIPCHCTGERAIRMLENNFPGQVSRGQAGRRFIFN